MKLFNNILDKFSRKGVKLSQATIATNSSKNTQQKYKIETLNSQNGKMAQPNTKILTIECIYYLIYLL